MSVSSRWCGARSSGLFLALAFAACDEGGSEVATSAEQPPGDDGEDCWQHANKDDCAAQGEACEFVSGPGGTYTRGACISDPNDGWCAPAPIGGSQTPSLWYEETTGRVLGLSFTPLGVPPGWERCPGPGGEGNDLAVCPSTEEACQVCICDEEESDAGGSTNGG